VLEVMVLSGKALERFMPEVVVVEFILVELEEDLEELEVVEPVAQHIFQ
jgi:hypothetical protein